MANSPKSPAEREANANEKARGAPWKAANLAKNGEFAKIAGEREANANEKARGAPWKANRVKNTSSFIKTKMKSLSSSMGNISTQPRTSIIHALTVVLLNPVPKTSRMDSQNACNLIINVWSRAGIL